MAKDYYTTLGVSRDASGSEIQKAYRRLAREFHPDLNPDDQTAKRKFQEVQKAFDVLNDSSKREMYDRYGSSFESMGGGPQGGGPQGAGPWRTAQGGGGFEDIDIGEMFGERFGEGEGFAELFRGFGRAGRQRGGQPASPPSRGADIKNKLDVTLRIAVTGGEANLTVQRAGGKTEQITVKIPAGIEDGKKIRLRGQGEQQIGGGPAGDILITVCVLPHACFQRHGNNLEIRVPVTLSEAAAGATVDVPTPSGTISLKVPPGSSSGTKLRVKGHGVSPHRGPPGDLYAEIQIVLPRSLDDDDVELINKLDAKHPQQPRSDLKW